MLLATVLLVSTNARAQISEAELQKADVNGDGNVDVADINGVIDIMKNLGKPDGVYKYYIGVVTGEQFDNRDYMYSLIQNSTTTFTGLPESIKYPDSVSNEEYIVFIYDSRMGLASIKEWPYGTNRDNMLESYGFSIICDLGNRCGMELNLIWTTSGFINYSNYITYQDGDVNADGWVNQSDINALTNMIKITSTMPNERYYVGVSDKIVFTEDDLNKTALTKPTILSFGGAPAGTNNYQTFVYPAAWGKPTSMMAGGLDGKGGWFWGEDAGMESLPPGYTAAVAKGGAVTYTVTWE